MKKLLLIGGSNIDYIGTSEDNLLDSVSNPGVITTSFGGVMRNTCEDLVRLGNKCVFLTAVGNDFNGKLLLDNLNDLGVEYYLPKTNYPSSSYMAINGKSHDMALAVSDTRILMDLNPEFIEANRKLIESYEYVAIDSNLYPEAIAYLVNTFPNIKIIAEAISPAKVLKYKEHLAKIYILKCNIHEAHSLVNEKIYGEELINRLFELGCNNVVVTSGPESIYVGTNKKDICEIKVAKDDVIVNTTGCGDAMFAGIIDKINQNKSLIDGVNFGAKLSKLTLQASGACSKELVKYAYDHKEEVDD